MVCRKCGLAKPPESFRVVTGKMRRRLDCIDCERTASRNRNRARAAELAAYSRAYYWSHREERAAYDRRRRAANGPHIETEAQKARHRETERLRKQARSPEQKQAIADRWREYFRDYHGTRRARAAGVIVEAVDGASVIARDGSRCYLCGKELAPGRDLTFDHVIPLSRGGPHNAANLRVACRRCNAKKRSRLLEEIA